jgi:hypothetical protein
MPLKTKHMDKTERRLHRVQIEILRRMTPEERLLKALELGDWTRRLFRHGLRQRFPEVSEERIQQMFLERMRKCYSRKS